jgi:hypothetical protein
MQDLVFAGNRFEVTGEPEDYRFFALKQSSAVVTRGMVFCDNELVPPADYRQLHLLYAKRYTPANVDIAVQWTVSVRARDPAGKPVGGVSVFARDGTGALRAAAITDREGHASLVLDDYRLQGRRGGDPCREQGPYELTFSYRDVEVRKQTLDPTRTTDLPVTVPEPNRRLYVHAGEDQRLTTGDVASIKGNVAVWGDEDGKPAVRWKVIKGVGGPVLANADAAETELTFENPTESWLQQAELELTATLGDQTASDRVTIRQDSAITPRAVITAPAEVAPHTIVQLDASRSKEPRRFPPERVRYRWRQTGGPAVHLSSPEWISPIFFPDRPGTYTFELTVSSPLATSEPVRHTVFVRE